MSVPAMSEKHDALRRLRHDLPRQHRQVARIEDPKQRYYKQQELREWAQTVVNRLEVT